MTTTLDYARSTFTRLPTVTTDPPAGSISVSSKTTALVDFPLTTIQDFSAAYVDISHEQLHALASARALLVAVTTMVPVEDDPQLPAGFVDSAVDESLWEQ